MHCLLLHFFLLRVKGKDEFPLSQLLHEGRRRMRIKRRGNESEKMKDDAKKGKLQRKEEKRERREKQSFKRSAKE